MRVWTLLMRNFTTKSITIPTIWCCPRRTCFMSAGLSQGRMVQHNRASGADRRIYGRSAVHLERGRRHRIRRQRKTNRWAGHDWVDLQCVGPDRLAANASLGTGKGFRPDQTAKGGAGVDSAGVDEGAHELRLSGFQAGAEITV